MAIRLDRGLLSLFLIGFIVILFEVIFTRICSGYLQYHYAFAALSIAMLSFCLSGIVYQKMTKREREVVFGWFLLFVPVSFLALIVAIIMSLGQGMSPFLPVWISSFLILFVCSFITLFLLERGREAGISKASCSGFPLNPLGGLASKSRRST